MGRLKSARRRDHGGGRILAATKCSRLTPVTHGTRPRQLPDGTMTGGTQPTHIRGIDRRRTIPAVGWLQASPELPRCRAAPLTGSTHISRPPRASLDLPAAPLLRPHRARHHRGGLPDHRLPDRAEASRADRAGRPPLAPAGRAAPGPGHPDRFHRIDRGDRDSSSEPGSGRRSRSLDPDAEVTPERESAGSPRGGFRPTVPPTPTVGRQV
jgi:hypothetical protein